MHALEGRKQQRTALPTEGAGERERFLAPALAVGGVLAGAFEVLTDLAPLPLTRAAAASNFLFTSAVRAGEGVGVRDLLCLADPVSCAPESDAFAQRVSCAELPHMQQDA